MKLEQVKNLQTGDRVYNGSLKGVVCLVTDGWAIAWTDRKGLDTLQPTSPLWQFLDVEVPAPGTTKRVYK